MDINWHVLHHLDGIYQIKVPTTKLLLMYLHSKHILIIVCMKVYGKLLGFSMATVNFSAHGVYLNSNHGLSPLGVFFLEGIGIYSNITANF